LCASLQFVLQNKSGIQGKYIFAVTDTDQLNSWKGTHGKDRNLKSLEMFLFALRNCIVHHKYNFMHCLSQLTMCVFTSCIACNNNCRTLILKLNQP